MRQKAEMRHKKRKSVSITVRRGFRTVRRVLMLFALLRSRFFSAAKRHRFTPSVKVVLGGVFVVLAVSLLSTVVFPQSTSASTGTEAEMSFEGKIVNSTGQNIPDGNYNMEFRIYTGCTNEPASNTGCTPVWTEDYLNNNTQGITFTSGTYQVSLGSICTFAGSTCENNTNSAVNWNSYPLYLSLQIGNTSNCSTNNPGSSAFTADCGGDGAMNPYILLTSTPYSFNSAELGGIAASGFVDCSYCHTDYSSYRERHGTYCRTEQWW